MSSLIQEAALSTAPFNRVPPRSAAAAVDPLLDRAMAMAGIGAWSCDLADERLNWTSGVHHIFGLAPGADVDRRDILALYTEESRDRLEELRRQTINRGTRLNLDAEIRRPDGEVRWLRINGELVWRPGSTPVLHGIKQDVTEEKRRLEALRRLAENDALTGLANRAIYEHRFLNRRCTRFAAARLGALVLFDLDGFKHVNDRLGHLAGDACLRTFAERLVAHFPQALLAARIGGDEFALVVDNQEPPHLVEQRVASFLEALRAPIHWHGQVFSIGATSGIAAPIDPWSYDPEELFIRADAALYAAKRARPQRR
ncbi:sensor domain-containing diguanylate cyclase [uncultured Sphingomonas sp.]|uniref:sensor domain-containing diguanylate cyclase n=1 Tax=unclassified Sphingomonas TaxID=196159 RepID=UPI0025E431A7|nr:sensor domain-containing diguanylate cyclase [uncultured Sphingomonas sp.]